MKVIPLRSVPSQTLKVILSGQNCRINVYAKSTGMFLDLFVGDSPVVRACICRNRVRLVRADHLGFIGDLAFFDTQGLLDPDYSGLGVRYDLIYLEAGDL